MNEWVSHHRVVPGQRLTVTAPPEVVTDVKRIVGECPSCWLRVNLPPKQIAKHYRAQRFNERAWLDIFFSTAWCKGPARDCNNLHMLAEGTWVCLLPPGGGSCTASSCTTSPDCTDTSTIRPSLVPHST